MPFKPNPKASPGWIQRLLPIPDSKGALAKLEDFLFGFPEDLKGLDRYRAAEIARPFRVSWKKRGSEIGRFFLVRFLQHQFNNPNLQTDWQKASERLAVFLGMPTKDLRQLVLQEGKEAYAKQMDAFLLDYHLDHTEKLALEKLANHLSIHEEDAKTIAQTLGQQKLEDRLEEMISDERLSPEELQELENLAQHFEIKLPEERLNSQELLRFQFYWLLESGPIPALKVQINLRKGEVAYLCLQVDWYEYRSRTRRISYGGPTARIRIARGIYWSAGSLGVERISEDYLKQIDQGSLYLTNKRLLFVGQKGNKQLPYSRILSYEPFSNGLKILKDSGPTPFLSVSNQVDFASILLDRMLFGAGEANK